jgi:hypothetical protein
MNFVAYSLLRDQLAVLQRQKNRVSLGAADRLLWVLLSRIWNQWRSALAVVKNSTPFGEPSSADSSNRLSGREDRALWLAVCICGGGSLASTCRSLQRNAYPPLSGQPGRSLKRFLG